MRNGFLRRGELWRRLIPALALASLFCLTAHSQAQYANHGPAILPDPQVNPGDNNPDINEENFRDTLCNPQWSTRSIRPPVSYTNKLKREQMEAYGDTVPQPDIAGKDGKPDVSKCVAHSGNPRCYEEDHIISLQLGGNPTAPQNLFPQPYWPKPGALEKDQVENYLHEMLCHAEMTLEEVQTEISSDWYQVYLEMPASAKHPYRPPKKQAPRKVERPPWAEGGKQWSAKASH